MDAVEHKLLNYDTLPAAERTEVDLYLADHPEAQALIVEGRTLRSLLDEATKTAETVPDAEDVARYVAAQYFGQQPLPPALVELGDRIEAAFASHPETERQYSIMRDRLRVLTEGSESPAAQFERLVGYSLDEDPDEIAVVATLPQPSAPTVGKPQPTSRHRSWRAPAADRESEPLLRRLSLTRLALAAFVLLGLVYGGFFLASNAQQTELAELAQLDEALDGYEGLRLRGVDGLMDPAAERYAAALDALSAAHSSTLGLFSSYDPDGLEDTIVLLREVTELEAPDAALGLEAWFLIGRVLLYKGDVEAAREVFRMVVSHNGPSAADALRLLEATADMTPKAATPVGP